ncbi:MAG: cell division protein FtsZ [Gemmatimonadetes bacterium]|nr:cell division protein FtsZ [Gemmatimonadota bacterium]
MRIELEDAPRNTALMRVIGVGGAGGNAINRMIEEELEGVDFISANTDAQALGQSRATDTIQLGKKLTRGLGAGARPGIGRQAVAEDADEVRAALDGADLVFIAAGMGGGTGTGAAPVVGEIARELGALTIAVVTRPFSFEGKRRMRQAEQGLAELRRTVDTMVVVPNDRLLPVVGKGTAFTDALKKADEVLLNATRGISDLIRVSGDVNVDFADVRTVMSSCGAALMGSGFGRGEDRALKAAQDAITSPLLDNISILGAKGVLINITGGSDLTIDEVTDISSLIADEAGDEAEIIFGTVLDSTMEEEIRVTLIATGFDDRMDRRGGDTVIRPTFTPRAAESDYEEPVIQQAVGDSSPAPRQAEPERVPAPRQQPVRAVAAGGGARPGLGSPFPPVSTAAASPLPAGAQARPTQARHAEARHGQARPTAARPAVASRPASVVITARKGGASELELPTFIRR